MRIKTKDQRLKIREASFNYMLENGYKRETYKDIDIFTQEKDGKYYLKIYRGTASSYLIYYYYNDEKRRTATIQQYKDTADRMQEYKRKAKENPTTSTAANCAKAIRTELKDAFKGVKFSVTSENFSGGNSVRISWTDGPTVAMVDNVANKYQYGHFNGMEDIYEYSNKRNDLPQVKYVQTTREINDDLKSQFKELLENNKPNGCRHDFVSLTCHRFFYNTPIPVNAKNIKVVKNESVTCGSSEEFYKLEFERGEETEKPNFSKVDTKAGEINVIDYSPKAVAIIGDTKPIKDKLKEIGASFNPRLTCGAGWILPKSQQNKLDAIFN